MNLEFFKTKIIDRFNKVEAFADALGVKKQSVYGWLRGEFLPEENRLLDIVDLLELKVDEVNLLLDVPVVEVDFRHKGGSKEASEEAKAKGKDLADTFFKIDSSSYVLKWNISTNLISKADIDEVARQIRQLVSIQDDEPVTLAESLYELKKHNLNIYFFPFQKTGLADQFAHHREVAFTAYKGDRVIIFVDANRTKDEALFDICHELAHIIFNPVANDKNFDLEAFCNAVAREMVYPKKFFETRQDILELFTNSRADNWNQWVSLYRGLAREFDWSPCGLGLALTQLGKIKKDSYEFSRFMQMDRSLKQERCTLDQLYYGNFDPRNFEQLHKFFSEKIQLDKEIYRPLIELKDAAISDQISSRRLAEILNMDSGDAHELIGLWRSWQEAENGQDDNQTPIADRN